MRAVVAIVMSAAACGRLDFALRDDATFSGDSGVGAPTAIFRSVTAGPGTAIISSIGMLSINGGTATFEMPTPIQVGVGDVIEYDSDGDGTRDALAFIHGRVSSQIYAVRTSLGSTPIATAGGTAQWGIFRAYVTLAHAVDRTTGGITNPNITAATFDGYGAGRDLVANDEQWSFAAYDDGQVDPTTASICSTSYTVAPLPGVGTGSCAAGWTTDRTHFIRIYTPTDLSEVGVSQRHGGVWGAGYRRSDGILMYGGFVHLDGLSIKRTASANYDRMFYVQIDGHGGEIWISNSFGWSTFQGLLNLYDVYDYNMLPGSDRTTLLLWNDIGFNESTTSAVGSMAAFYINSPLVDATIYNCSAVIRGSAAFLETTAGLATVKNSIGFNAGVDLAFVSGRNFRELTHSVSNDPSIGLLGYGTANTGSAIVTFTASGIGDFHLDAGNLSLIGTAEDLSADSVIPFSNDIDNAPRTPGAWDIGADQRGTSGFH